MIQSKDTARTIGTRASKSPAKAAFPKEPQEMALHGRKESSMAVEPI